MSVAKPRAAGKKRNTGPKFDHDRILQIPTGNVRPSPENDQIYRPVDSSDPQIVALADSIRNDPRGIREPLIVSTDGYIVSGHRRHCAAMVVGLAMVPCIRLRLRRDEYTADQWLVILPRAQSAAR